MSSVDDIKKYVYSKIDPSLITPENEEILKELPQLYNEDPFVKQLIDAVNGNLIKKLEELNKLSLEESDLKKELKNMSDKLNKDGLAKKISPDSLPKNNPAEQSLKDPTTPDTLDKKIRNINPKFNDYDSLFITTDIILGTYLSSMKKELPKEIAISMMLKQHNYVNTELIIKGNSLLSKVTIEEQLTQQEELIKLREYGIKLIESIKNNELLTPEWKSNATKAINTLYDKEVLSLIATQALGRKINAEEAYQTISREGLNPLETYILARIKELNPAITKNELKTILKDEITQKAYNMMSRYDNQVKQYNTTKPSKAPVTA